MPDCYHIVKISHMSYRYGPRTEIQTTDVPLIVFDQGVLTPRYGLCNDAR